MGGMSKIARLAGPALRRLRAMEDRLPVAEKLCMKEQTLLPSLYSTSSVSSTINGRGVCRMITLYPSNRLHKKTVKQDCFTPARQCAIIQPWALVNRRRSARNRSSKMFIKNHWLLPMLVAGLGSVMRGHLPAQTLTTLYSFAPLNNYANSDGSYPLAGLILSGTCCMGRRLRAAVPTMARFSALPPMARDSLLFMISAMPVMENFRLPV